VFVVPGANRPVVLSFVLVFIFCSATFVRVAAATTPNVDRPSDTLVLFPGTAAAPPSDAPRRDTTASNARDPKAITLSFVAMFTSNW
jgi:hypothetical protein